MELSKNIMVEPSTDKNSSRNPFVTLFARFAIQFQISQIVWYLNLVSLVQESVKSPSKIPLI